MNCNNVFTERQLTLAIYAKVLSHPIRLFILNELLKTGTCSKYSSDIHNKLSIAKSTFCQHLKVLRESDLVLEEMDFPRIKYCINRNKWNETKELFSHIISR